MAKKSKDNRYVKLKLTYFTYFLHLKHKGISYTCCNLMMSYYTHKQSCIMLLHTIFILIKKEGKWFI